MKFYGILLVLKIAECKTSNSVATIHGREPKCEPVVLCCGGWHVPYPVMTMKKSIIWNNGLTVTYVSVCMCIYLLMPPPKHWKMEQEDMVSKQVFLHYVSYTNKLRKKVVSMQAKENWSNIPTGGWSWGRLIWLAIIRYLLPSTKPHQSTKCLPSTCSHFHTMHTRNYKTALHISGIFKKEEFTFTIHSLPYWCICKETPLPKHIIMKMYRSHRNKHQPVQTSTTEACM